MNYIQEAIYLFNNTSATLKHQYIMLKHRIYNDA